MKDKKRKIYFNNTRNSCNARQGIALLVVLFIIMTITILTVGYMTRSDIELLTGSNADIKADLDYLAESGLEHAKGLLLMPTGVVTPPNYWTGASRQQLLSGNDYYDVNVAYTASDVNSYYTITATAYRESGGTRIAQSKLAARLPLNFSAPVKYWKLNDGVGTAVVDSSSKNIPGAWYGVALNWVNGLYNKAVNFGLGNVTLYDRANYDGWDAGFNNFGFYDLPDLIAAGGQNDDAGSIRIPTGYKVVLYEHAVWDGAHHYYDGQRSVKYSDDSSFSNDGWLDNAVSSLELGPVPTADVILYQNSSYGGWAAHFAGVGTYRLADIIAAGGTNDAASSIRVPSGYRVTLYEHDPPGGRTLVKTADDSSLYSGDNFDNMTSSLKVEYIGGMVGYIRDNAATSSLTSGSATVSFWMRMPAVYNSNAPVAVICTANYDYQVGVNSNAKLVVSRVGTSSMTTLAGPSAKSVNDDQWHHVIFTLDSANSKVRLYIDGNLEAVNSSAYSNNYAETYFYLGYRSKYTSAASYYVGKIDEVLVYAKPLNQLQIDYLIANQLLPCTATTMYVNSIISNVVFSRTVDCGYHCTRYYYKGRATVTVYNMCGQPVQNATVTGRFTGDFSETKSAVTNAAGTATLTTSDDEYGTINYDFCVTNITHAALTYAPAANQETCDDYYGSP